MAFRNRGAGGGVGDDIKLRLQHMKQTRSTAYRLANFVGFVLIMIYVVGLG